ncbi:uncharacterized protein DS421_13g399650 [Arachis hypogaea]|nr:uncharacterized protein DS421_13g399650 [Arachis hypogaea]
MTLLECSSPFWCFTPSLITGSVLCCCEITTTIIEAQRQEFWSQNSSHLILVREATI